MTPAQESTVLWVAGVIFLAPILAGAVMLWVELRTLKDGTPENHITAAMRAAFWRAPGPVMLTLLIWASFVALIIGVILGHIFWCTCV